jgi:hypothetical protein
VAFAAAIQRSYDIYLMPFSYKKIEPNAPSTIWSHIRLNGDFQPGSETVSSTTIMDPDGGNWQQWKIQFKKVTAMPPPRSFQWYGER